MRVITALLILTISYSIMGKSSDTLEVLLFPQTTYLADTNGVYLDQPTILLSASNSLFRVTVKDSLVIDCRWKTYLRFKLPAREELQYIGLSKSLNYIKLYSEKGLLSKNGSAYAINDRAIKEDSRLVVLPSGSSGTYILELSHPYYPHWNNSTEAFKVVLLGANDIEKFVNTRVSDNGVAYIRGNIAFLGLIFFFLFLVFVQYYTRKERVYLDYLFYFGLIGIYYLIRKTHGFWPELIFLRAPIKLLIELTSPAIFTIAYLNFLKSFLRLKRSIDDDRINKMIRLSILWCLAYLVLSAAMMIFLAFSAAYRIQLVLLLGLLIYCLFMLYRIASRRERLSSIITIGASILICSIVGLHLCRWAGDKLSWGTGAANVLGISIFQWGVLAESILFYYGLQLWQKLQRQEREELLLNHEYSMSKLQMENQKLKVFVESTKKEIKVKQDGQKTETDPPPIIVLDITSSKKKIVEPINIQHLLLIDGACYLYLINRKEGGGLSKQIVSMGLGEMEKLLAPYRYFIRIHRKQIVNLKYVQSINSNKVRFLNGEEFVIGRAYKSGLREKLEDLKQ